MRSFFGGARVLMALTVLTAGIGSIPLGASGVGADELGVIPETVKAV